MKINAQLEGRPTLRNIAKLLMNAHYDRLGMHPNETLFVNSIELNAIASQLGFSSVIAFSVIRVACTHAPSHQLG